MLRRLSGMAIPAVVLAALGTPAPVRADNCLQDAWDAGTVPSMVLFPNYLKTHVASDVIWLWDTNAGPENIRGLTIANFGNAGSSDLTGVYAYFSCGATNSGTLTLTYAGIYGSDNGAHPAWTWAGNTADFSGCADLCGAPFPCGGYFNLDLYVDIAACPPTPLTGTQATVNLGIPTSNSFANGGVSDGGGCQAPTGPASGADHTIQYVYKLGPDKAVPGDTIEFTLYYGRPGAGPTIPTITLFDSLPQYTHYVSASTAPDAGWDPDPGPPTRLQWTLNGPFPVAGGGTNELKFKVSVDWGNGESFEPGSGDTAAPEGQRLANRAHATFAGAACSAAVSNQVQTVARRFLMYMLADNDMLFSSSVGQPPDEMTYTVFVRNLSTSKTWWAVSLWDTVPAQLDPWCVNCGFEDPCLGWTMTPSGCASSSPGKLVSGGNTVLTWGLDMPPNTTVAFRWKAQVKPSVGPPATAVNVLSLREMGRSRVIFGTGDSTYPANFAHVALILLPTTYVSYVAYSGDRWDQPDSGDALNFFPLNKKTQFELRSLDYVGGWAGTGGVSASIGCLLGDCLGGFPGSGGSCPNAGGIGSDPSSRGGCRVERIPARYNHPKPVNFPYQHLYKITSNSPVNWQSEPGVGTQCGDFHMYAPASNLSYVGLLHYFWKNSYIATNYASGTEMVYMSVGKDPFGNTDTTLDTQVHIFRFNYGTLGWDYMNAYDIGPESVVGTPGTVLGEEGPYRSVSSQGQLAVWQGYQSYSILGCGCPCHNISAMMPVRETGNVVGFAGETFYGIVEAETENFKVVVGNLNFAAAAGTNAMYRVYRYIPDSTPGPASVPVNLQGSSGTWQLQGTHVVPSGFFSVNNPRIYADEATWFNGTTTAAYKVELVSGGPVQIHHGVRVFIGWGGGAVLHAVDGEQTGQEFWVHNTNHDDTAGTVPELFAIDAFCPKKDMVVHLQTEDGRNEEYTTTGPDQCVAFLNFAAPARKRNIRITQLAVNMPDMIVQYINAGPEKGYTAPFLQNGQHYNIIAPPVVYVGQQVWITVVVIQAVGGATDTSYTGITSFTSSDSGALLQGLGMDSYNYTWVPVNGGVKLFINVVFTKLGFQSIVATDTLDGSITGVTTVQVVGADIKLIKEPPLQVSASGDVVQFKICWSNYSTATGSNFTVTDRVPDGTVYFPDSPSNHYCGATKGFGAATVAYSTNGGGTYSTLTGPASTAVTHLRWTIPTAGVATTGCVCFKVTVQ